MNKFFTAFQHLIFLKKDSGDSFTVKEIQQSLLFFPLIGFCIGIFLVLTNIAVSALLPDRIVDICLVLTLLVLTSARHLQGVLSVVTGIDNFPKIKSVSSDIALKIFIVLFFMLMIKYLLLNSIVPGWKNEILLVMPVMGRWSLIFLPYLALTRPRQNLKINPLYGKINVRDFWVGTVTTSTIVILLLGINGIIVFMMMAFITVFLERLYQRKEQGAPECLSLAIVEIAEIITLIFFIILEFHSRNILINGVLV